MAKRFPKQPKIPPRQCIFCDGNANSKEHFWPEWMHEILPNLPDPRYDRLKFDFHPETGTMEKGVRGRQGHLHSLTIQAVCIECNTTWMNQLEGAVRPLLRPIIEGTPVALDSEQMSVIARWITLKCIVAEHKDSHVSLTPRADRVAFREDGIIPDYFRIYIANHNMPSAAGFLRRSAALAINSTVYDPPLGDAFRNVETISFVIGRVFVHLNAARIKDFDIESRYVIPLLYGHCRIWPIQHDEMVWPRRPLFDRNGMAMIAESFDTLQKNAIVGWLPRVE